MTKDRFGRSETEIMDERREHFIKGTWRIRQLADMIGEWHVRGTNVTVDDLQECREVLDELMDHVYLGTVYGFGLPQWSFAEIDSFMETYSDETPIVTVLGDFRRREGEALPGDFAAEIPWCPAVSAVPPGTETYGGTPPGAVILIADPPHRREAEGQPIIEYDEDDDLLVEDLTIEQIHFLLHNKTETGRNDDGKP